LSTKSSSVEAFGDSPTSIMNFTPTDQHERASIAEMVDEKKIIDSQHIEDQMGSGYDPEYRKLGINQTLKTFKYATFISVLAAIGAVFDAYVISGKPRLVLDL
jgi:hypothetical protein